MAYKAAATHFIFLPGFFMGLKELRVEGPGKRTYLCRRT